MNSSQISTFIKNPSLITVNDVDALKNLANEYSYSETLQFLYLYAVSKHADMKFDEALLSTAYRITHRERIVELLDDSSITTVHSEEQPIQEAQEEENVQQQTDVQESIETGPLTETEETVEDFIADEAISSTEVIEDANEQVDELDALIYNTTATALEQDYLTSQAIMEFTEESEANTITEAIDEKVEEIKQTPVSEDSKMSFTSWLHQNNHAVSDEKKISPTQKHKEEIIDRFIETQPRISKPTAEFYSASKKAKESLDATRNPVSETLAKIYEAQGNYQKAIHVYHQLILNYPEKRRLFAPRIEELKNKLSQ